MDVKANLNGVRIAPRKVRSVANLLKKRGIDAALDQLAGMPKRAVGPLTKLLHSAVANAENNFRMVRSNLFVKDVWVDEGVKLRRWMPKGFGRTSRIQKKTSRVNVILGERVAGMRQAERAAKAPEHAHAEPAKEPPKRGLAPVAEAKKPATGLRGLTRRLFQRKTI